ncbi:MAG: hypothetical protein KJ893_04355, partial [Candidatus Omnitrophica bacterium]|nr:hypothetical protein [Candidatus Omnitrophota bacterium]
EFAKDTEGKVGADIEFICRKAAMLAIREYIEKHRPEGSGLASDSQSRKSELKISKQHFEEAVGLMNTKDTKGKEL